MSAIGSGESAPAARASRTCRAVSSSQLASSPNARATRHASHSRAARPPRTSARRGRLERTLQRLARPPRSPASSARPRLGEADRMRAGDCSPDSPPVGGKDGLHDLAHASALSEAPGKERGGGECVEVGLAESLASSFSSRLAAARAAAGASRPRSTAKRICARSSSARHAEAQSRGPASAMPRSSRAHPARPPPGCTARRRERGARAARVRRQIGGPSEERGRRGEAPARLCSAPTSPARRQPARRAPASRARDARLGGRGRRPGRSPRQERGARAGGSSQRRGPVDSRSHERVTESNAHSELEEPGARRRYGRLGADTQQLGRAPHGQGIAHRLGRGDEQELPAAGRKPAQPPPEALLDMTGERRTCRQPESTGQLGMAEAVRQLQQRQRIPTGFRHDPVANPLVQRARDHRREQGARVVACEAVDHQLRKPRQLPAELALGEHHRDPLRAHSPRYEGERLRRLAIEPLRIVHLPEHRPLGGHVGEKRQRCQPDEKSVRWLAGPTQPEGRGQRVALRLRQKAQAIQHRQAELMQGGEGKLHLGLDPCGPHDLAARRLRLQVVQQRGLADPRLAAQDKRSAVARKNSRDNSIEGLALAPATPQSAAVAAARCRHHERLLSHRRSWQAPAGPAGLSSAASNPAPMSIAGTPKRT